MCRATHTHSHSQSFDSLISLLSFFLIAYKRVKKGINIQCAVSLFYERRKWKSKWETDRITQLKSKLIALVAFHLFICVFGKKSKWHYLVVWIHGRRTYKHLHTHTHTYTQKYDTSDFRTVHNRTNITCIWNETTIITVHTDQMIFLNDFSSMCAQSAYKHDYSKHIHTINGYIHIFVVVVVSPTKFIL